MRIGVTVGLLLLIITGCAYFRHDPAKALLRIQPGDAEKRVVALLGHPDGRTEVTEQRYVLFYRIARTSPSGAAAAGSGSALVPISFENGQVVAVDEDLSSGWQAEHQALLRQTEMDQRREAEKIREAHQWANRRWKITELEKEVRLVPTANIDLNLKLYRQLRALDPNNPRYREKVAFYEGLQAQQIAQQEKEERERLAQVAKEKRRLEWEHARDQRNKTLRQYVGNGAIEMAIHDMGNGSLYVWLKNVGNQTVTTHPDHFTLFDQGRQPVVCQVSDSLVDELSPGGVIHGKIEYDMAILPAELVFQNPGAGRVGKKFQ